MGKYWTDVFIMVVIQSDTDIRIRRRFNRALSPEEVPASVKGFCETLSADSAASSSVALDSRDEGTSADSFYIQT